MTLFRVPKLPADTPPGLGAVLANAFKQLYADLQALFDVPGDITIRTSSYRPVAGETVRVSPPAEGMGFILPAPAADNRGARITAILESPEGALRVFVSPGSSPTGNGAGLPTIDGAEMASFTAAGAVPFVSNGVDKWSVARGPAGAAGATGAPGPGAEYTVFELDDDFVGGTDVSGSASTGTRVGTYSTSQGSWSVSGSGSVAEFVGSTDHPGVAALISTDASQGIHLHLGQSLLGNGTVCEFQEFEEFTVSVAVQGPAPSNVQFGLRNDTGPHFIRMQSTPLTATWDCQCMTSGTPTDVTAGTVPSSLFSTYSMKQPTVGTIEFWQDGVLIATISTNVPSSALCNLSFDIYNTAGYALYVDKIRFKTKPLAR